MSTLGKRGGGNLPPSKSRHRGEDREKGKAPHSGAKWGNSMNQPLWEAEAIERDISKYGGEPFIREIVEALIKNSPLGRLDLGGGDV